MKSNGVTEDDLFIGGFRLLQPKEGYRFSVDAVLLAAFPSFSPGETVLDMGCGSGVLPLLMLGREPSLKVSAVELMDKAYALAVENRRCNGVSFDLFHGDAMKATELFPEGFFDHIVSNPPYYPVGRCRLPRDPDIAAAKTELYWDQKTMLEQAFLLSKVDGDLSLVFDASRKEELIAVACECGWFLNRCCDVYGKEGDKSPRRVLLSFGKEPGAVKTDSLTIFDENGSYSRKMKRILEIYHGTGTVPCGDPHRESR